MIVSQTSYMTERWRCWAACYHHQRSDHYDVDAAAAVRAAAFGVDVDSHVLYLELVA